MYAVSSVWNREKGRAQKVTDKYLGRITEEGFIPSKKGTLKMETPITVKESGASGVLTMLGEDILVELRKTFPRHGELIFTISILRLIEHSPFKRLENQYRNSFLSETFKGLKMSTGSLSVFLRDFGGDREKIVEFMKRFVTGSEHILFDGTNILSKSKKMDMNRVGYNKNRDFAPRLNLLYAFAHEAEQPVYYRITAGNVSDISAFKLTIAETGLENVTVVADKGFASEANFRMPEKSGVMYVTPLKRNSALIDTDRLETGGKADLDGYFLFNERPIRHYSAGSVAIFLDGELKAREEKKYLGNIEKGKDGYTMENFIKNQHKFGTIALKTNSLKSPQDVYCIYKGRMEIEQSFDFLKNLPELDKSYMQNEKSLEAWAFINHISLLLNYKIYNLLRCKGLLSKFSVADFLAHLKYIYKIKVNNSSHLSEYTKKTVDFLSVMDLHIT